ncbi:MAG: hypothetical protein QY328_11960 [Anaerolineales bacterium]|nr:MAG: hypothetical protein QY328_11960 [Anaerolineales bacterium]
MFHKKPLKAIAMLLAALVLLACGLFSSPEPTPEPAQSVDTPTLIPTPVSPTTTPTKIPPTLTNTPSAPDDLFDGRLGISVSKIEFTKTLPDEYDLPNAGDRDTYVSIHIAVTRIVGTHITNLVGFEKEKSILHDDKGQNYTLVYGTFKGIRFSDPTNITSSYEFIKGAEGVLVFEIPEDQKPATLDLIYTYQESLDDDSAKKRGEITITFGDTHTSPSPLLAPMVLNASEARKLLESGKNYRGIFGIARTQYTEDELNDFIDNLQPIPITLTERGPVRVGYAWCATNQDILQGNLAFIQVTYKLEDKIVPSSNIDYTYFTNDEGWECVWMTIVIDNWVSGTYTVSQEFKLTQDINDGESDFEPYTDETIFIVTVP